MTRYTLGFIFNKDFSKVLLIHKLAPSWQKGRVNGLGGKYEAGEDCFACIVREVKEEADLSTLGIKWRRIGGLKSDMWEVDVLSYVYEGPEADAVSAEKQKVEWFSLLKLPENIISNLSWLIPLCLDAIKNTDIDVFSVKYNN